MHKVTAILTILLLPVMAYGQKDSLQPDQLFQHARELAFTNHGAEARSVARAVLKANDRYYDARILIGRTYAWEHRYDSASYELNRVVAADSSNLDALSALTDVYYWWSNQEEALRICNRALSYAPYDEALLLKKVKILLAMDQEDEARRVLSTLLKIHPYGAEINALLAGLKKQKNRIALEHTFDYFATPYHQRWHVTSLQYQHDFRKGTIIGKMNVGQRVESGQQYLSNPEMQVEVDAYPILGPGTYAYLNYGYAPGKFFPHHRVGIEPFHVLGMGWECSLGARFFFLKIPAQATPDVTILTGSLSRYMRKDWYSFRPYFTFYHGFSQSYYALYRHYLSFGLNYFGGALGYGNSPDEKNASAAAFANNRNSSFHLRAEYQHRLGKSFLYRLLPEYTLEEYHPGNYRNRFTGNIYLAFLF